MGDTQKENAVILMEIDTINYTVKKTEKMYKIGKRPLLSKGMDTTMKRKAQDNSFLARPWRSKYKTLYGTAWFLLMYSLLLYVGSRLFFVAGTLCEGGKRWPSFLIVGLIILASSLLSKMFQDWLREKGNNRDKANNGGR